MQNNKVAIVIPVRLASVRLPNKPLLPINNIPMVIWVINQAVEVVKQFGNTMVIDIIVAVADKEIQECVVAYYSANKCNASITCVLTNPALPSGSDRANQALNLIDSANTYNYVVNLQGDLPTILAQDIIACLNDIITSNYDITTLACPINNTQDHNNINIVKPILSNLNSNTGLYKALYFTRASAPYNMASNSVVSYHHIGIYAYKRQALQLFTSYKPSYLEETEKLEQLRALENNLTIGVRIVNSVPIGVDTQQDLLKAQEILKQR